MQRQQRVQIRVMAHTERQESQSRRVVRTSMVSTTTRTTSLRRVSSERREVKMEIKGSPFPAQEVNLFTRHVFDSSTESMRWQSGSNNSIDFNSFDRRSLPFNTSGVGRTQTEARGMTENGSKSSSRDYEPPMEAVVKEKSDIQTPEWMEEKQSPEPKRKIYDTALIDLLLKYPLDNSPNASILDPKKTKYESRIRPEVAKREKAAIPILSLDDFDKKDDNDDDDDYDEFEEVIVVMDVQRKPIWRKGLEKPKPQPFKVGTRVEDLLQLPAAMPKVKSYNDTDKSSVDEKIESVERPPVVHEGLDLEGILENL